MTRPVLSGALLSGDKVVLYHRAGRGQVMHRLIHAAHHRIHPWEGVSLDRDTASPMLVVTRNLHAHGLQELLDALTFNLLPGGGVVVVVENLTVKQAEWIAEADVEVGDRQALVLQVRCTTKRPALPPAVMDWATMVVGTELTRTVGVMGLSQMKAPVPTHRAPWPTQLVQGEGCRW